MKKIKFGLLLSIITVCACGTTVRRSDLGPSANASEEIAKLETDIQTGYSDQQLDIVAPRDFAEAQKYLEAAKRQNKKNPDRALDEVAWGRAYMQRALNQAQRYTPNVAGILEARQDALIAGARDTKKSRARLKELDDYLRSDVKKGYDTRNFAAMQNAYFSLELAAISNRQLGDARERLKRAKDQLDTAPRTLRQAELAVREAENFIAANRHNPAGYVDAVNRANQNTILLTEVLAITNKRGANVDENAALTQVRQRRQIQNLQGQVGSMRGQLGGAAAALSEKNRALADATAREEFQNLMERVQREFNAEEAEVFQQGNRLVIRLKKLGFPTGSAEIPNRSLPLLAKVKNVAEELDPAEILVEGHTDSIGGEETNMKLSEKRAEAVANYFGTEDLKAADIKVTGEGFNKPIATNKTSTGRAQNRRVDVIITPTAIATFGD